MHFKYFSYVTNGGGEETNSQKRGRKVDLLLCITVGFIIIGFVILVSMKKSMESKLTFIKRNIETEKSLTTPIVWWIVGTTVWGIVSILLIVWWFSLHMK